MNDKPVSILAQLLTEEELNLLNQNKNLALPKILRFHEIIQKLVSLTDFNLREKALAATAIHHNLLTVLFQEEALLKKLKEDLENTEVEYVKKFGNPNIPKFKTATEAKSCADVKILEKQINEQGEIVRYLIESLKIMNSYSFNIKNCVELSKLES